MTAQAVYEALARLRLGMPKTEVQRAFGAHWSEPKPKDKGFVSLRVHDAQELPRLPFTVRLDVDGRIGHLGYFSSFPPGLDVGGVAISMAEADVLERFPDARIDREQSAPRHGIEAFSVALRDDERLLLKMKQGRLLAAVFERVGAAYAGETSSAVGAAQRPMRAYDLKILPRFTDAADNHG